MNLYEIDKSIYELLEYGYNRDCIDYETGEILFDKASEMLDNFSMDRKTKIENIALFIKDLQSEAEAIKQEEEKLKARRQAKERKAESLANYLKNSMVAFGDTKIETTRAMLTIRTTKAVVVEDIEKLDSKYYNEKTEKVADKKAIKKAIEDGEQVEGAYISENQNLQIK